MKIVHIQNSMPPAGNACYRLHSAMRDRGILSFVLNVRKSMANRNFVYSPKRTIHSLIHEVISFLHGKYLKRLLRRDAYFFSFKPIIGADLCNQDVVKEADAVYLHWIAGGSITFKEIDRLACSGKPIVFYMHDMWDFTGGCHHSFDCKQYETGCAECPMFKKKSKQAKKQIEAKFNLYSKHSNIVFVSPSEWIAECARKSYALKESRVVVISNIVDETIFKPINKETSREILNLPLKKRIISFGCQAGTDNPYKGWDYLKRALGLINRDDIQILVYGVDYKKEIEEQIPYPVCFLGPIFDETKLALICNASDVYVSPSLAESFGMTFLENILCGTPVVGFDNTAVGEIVKDNQTGYLAANKDARDLAKGIDKILNLGPSFKVSYRYSTRTLIDQHMRLLEGIRIVPGVSE